MAGGRSAKNKGARFERELADFFSESLGIHVSRSYFTRDPLMRKGDGAADLIGLPELAIEAKRVERLDFPGAMVQAKRNAQGNEMPVVVNRRNRQSIDESYVLVELQDFVRLYHAWGQSRGYFRPAVEAASD